jgi:hypothetical protein
MNKNKIAKTAGENFLKETIKNLGLTYDIQHTIFPSAQRIKTPEKTITNAIGMTEVKLYPEDDMKVYKSTKTPFNKRRAVAYGITYCSASENFNKQTGRICALQRAIIMYNPKAFKATRKERKNTQKMKNKRL